MRPRPPSSVALLLAAFAGCKGRLAPTFAPPPRTIVERPEVPLPPSPASGAAAFRGLETITPSADAVELSWSPLRDTDGAIDAAYAYEVRATLDGRTPVLDGAPTATTAPGASSETIAALEIGTTVRAVVRAIRLDGSPVAADRNDVELRAEIRPLLYVDAAADGSGDGRSPAAPLASINDAIGTALGDGSGANVQIAEGRYVEEVALLGTVHLYGGCPHGFAGARDPAAHRTTIAPADGAAVAIRLFANPDETIVDGLDLDGGGSVQFGLDLRDASLQLTRGAIFGFAGEGIVLNTRNSRPRVALADVVVAGNGAEGMQAAGALDGQLARCSFDGNAHEGIEFDDLTVGTNDRTRLRLWRCDASDNREEGLDADLDELDPASGSSSTGSTIELSIEECRFERNGTDGLLLDVDYDAADGLLAQVLVRDSRLAANGRFGADLDGDEPALFVLAGCRASANRLGGLRAGSDSPDGGRALFLVADHFDLGSDGAAIAAYGPADVVLSRAAILGASGAAIAGNGATRLASGALLDGAAATGATVEWSFVAAGGGGRGCFAGAIELASLPLPLGFAVANGASDRVVLPVGAPLAVGDAIEIDDDGVARTVVARDGAAALFAPARAIGVATGSFVALLPDGSAEENLALPAGSPWIDAGEPLDVDPDGSAADVGALGGRIASFRASASSLLPFVAQRLEPGLGIAATRPAELAVTFTRDVDPRSVDAASFAVTRDGATVAGTHVVEGPRVRFLPAVPFAAGELEIALGPTLAAVGGELLALPFRFAVQLP